jgi:hypothetical protein
VALRIALYAGVIRVSSSIVLLYLQLQNHKGTGFQFLKLLTYHLFCKLAAKESVGKFIELGSALCLLN